jgi:hypothetical protein
MHKCPKVRSTKTKEPFCYIKHGRIDSCIVIMGVKKNKKRKGLKMNMHV